MTEREVSGYLMGLGGCAIIVLFSVALEALVAYVLMTVWNELHFQPRIDFWMAFGILIVLGFIAGLFKRPGGSK